MKFTIHLLILSTFLISCSSTKKKKTAPKEEVKINIEERFDQLIKAIKGKGGEMERFVIDDMYLKASHASIRGDIKSALFYWEKILLIKSDNSFINKKYAVDLIRAGKLVKAKTVLEKIDKKNGANKDENLTMVLAGLYVSTGEKEKAKEIYRYLVKNNNNSEACIFLGRFYAEEKNYSKAEKTLRDCEKKDKKAIFAFFRGKFVLEQKKRKQAVKHFKRALKIDESFQDAALELGRLYESGEKQKKAERIYKKFLEKNPDNFSVLSALVKGFFSQGAKPEVIPYVEKLSSLDQENLNLKVRLGILYSDAKRYEDSIGVFSEILEIVPDSEKILYYLASLYQQVEKLDTSVEYYLMIPDSGALFKDAQVQIAKIYNGKSYTQDGKINKEFADKLIRFVEERSLKYPIVAFDLKIVLVGLYENTQDFNKAVVLMKDLKSNAKFKEEHEYYLASLLDKDNRFEEAREILEGILAKNPNNPHALNFLAYSYIEKDIELDEALRLLKKAVSLKPNDGYIRDSLGWYYYKMGDLQKALVELKKAWQREKSDVVITKHLAIIYQDLKRYRMAEKYFSEALKNCKQDHERMAVLQAMKNLEKVRVADIKRRLPASLK
ncbi:MAG: hypothetical protein DRQ88_01175 [Epsilonproteobacteria bacterium]|nr:MAG: hypothetical protein DRQ89_05240 [Campylobacterota bacterium]RLA67906.1 MAG: hypothetical protein DRQ88_01175 [Campylobacterota bacterium]